MVPVLWEIGGVPVYAHGFFSFLALVAGVLVFRLEAHRRRWLSSLAWPIAGAAFVGGMLGARYSILFLNGWETAPVILDPRRLFDPTVGPGSILGGVIGAYIGGFAASRLGGLRGCACDAFAPALALAMFIGRFGCFLAGEDGLGKATALPWGIRLSPGDMPVHPTPLYDGLFNLVWFGILLGLRDHPRMQDGNLLKVGVAGYALFRFFVEFLRTNRLLAWGLTPHQFVCLGLLLAIGAYYGRRRLTAGRSPVIGGAPAP